MLPRRFIIAAAAAAAALAGAASANAKTLVSTISGGYDLGPCCGSTWDTPALYINNSSGGAFVNAQMELIGYQGDNLGQSVTVNLGTIGNGTQDQLYWGSLPGVSGSTSPFNLAAYDYDDEFIGTKYIIPDPNCGSSCVAGGGPAWYAQTGNFKVIFTATVSGGGFNGQNVYAAFSPTYNATGHFVGWEGLDPKGYSEQNCCDVHNGTVTGDLANIYLGNPTGVPEPATWAMLIAGAAGIGASLRGRRKLATA